MNIQRRDWLLSVPFFLIVAASLVQSSRPKEIDFDTIAAGVLETDGIYCSSDNTVGNMKNGFLIAHKKMTREEVVCIKEGRPYVGCCWITKNIGIQLPLEVGRVEYLSNFIICGDPELVSQVVTILEKRTK